MDPTIEMRIKALLTRRLGVPPETISLEASLVDEFGLDSVDMVELTIAVEQEFKITFDHEEFREVRLISDVVGLVERLVAAQASSA